MPKESLSLYFAIQTSGLDGLTSLTEKTKSLDKETQQLAQSAAALKSANDPLIKKQQELQIQLEESSRKVQEARKAFRQHADETSKLNLSHAIAEQNSLKNSLKLTADEYQSNEKLFKQYVNEIETSVRRFDDMSLDDAISEAYGIKKAEEDLQSLMDVSDEAHRSLRDLSEQYRKSEQREDGGSGGKVSLLAGLQKAGLLKMFGDAGSEALGAFTESVLGQPAASALSSLISGLASGAALGSVVPGLGTLGGAAIGSLSGLISASTQVFEAKDDAFKSYYKGLYDRFDATEGISGGSATASGRETDLISLTTMFGDEDAAESYLDRLVAMSNRTPFLYSDLMSMSKTLATFGYDDTNILPVLETIGDAGAALGQSTSDMNSVATAIGRMVSSDKATLEYLNILNDRGINAVGYLAEARGKSVADTYSDISKGNISGTEAAEIILAAMEERYAGSMEAQSKTFSGLSSTLEGLRQEVDNAAGERYNTLRGEGIQAEINSLGGPLGAAVREMNAIIGQNQAYLENLSDQYQRDALNYVLRGVSSDFLNSEENADLKNDLDGIRSEFVTAKEDFENGSQEAGLKLQELFELTQETAQGYYESSDIMQEKTDAAIEHLESIRKNTEGLASALYDYRLGQTASKGMLSGRALGGSQYDDITNNLSSHYRSTMSAKELEKRTRLHSNAFGLHRVPYDDYPTLLHEGERVLTAREARELDGAALSDRFGPYLGGKDGDSARFREDIALLLRDSAAPPAAPAGSGEISAAPIFHITVTGNTITGAGEELADQVAEVIARKLKRAAIIHQPR